MNKLRILIATAIMALAASNAFAQGPGGAGEFPGGGRFPGMRGGEGREREMVDPTANMNPAEKGKFEADRLKEVLNLDEKQYKQIYTYTKNQATADENRASMGGGFGGPMGFPGMGGSNDLEQVEKAYATKAKKYQKILRPDQFVVWEKMQQQDLQRKRERAEKAMKEREEMIKNFENQMRNGGPGGFEGRGDFRGRF